MYIYTYIYTCIHNPCTYPDIFTTTYMHTYLESVFSSFFWPSLLFPTVCMWVHEYMRVHGWICMWSHEYACVFMSFEPMMYDIWIHACKNTWTMACYTMYVCTHTHTHTHTHKCVCVWIHKFQTKKCAWIYTFQTDSERYMSEEQDSSVSICLESLVHVMRVYAYTTHIRVCVYVQYGKAFISSKIIWRGGSRLQQQHSSIFQFGTLSHRFWAFTHKEFCALAHNSSIAGTMAWLFTRAMHVYLQAWHPCMPADRLYPSLSACPHVTFTVESIHARACACARVREKKNPHKKARRGRISNDGTMMDPCMSWTWNTSLLARIFRSEALLWSSWLWSCPCWRHIIHAMDRNVISAIRPWHIHQLCWGKACHVSQNRSMFASHEATCAVVACAHGFAAGSTPHVFFYTGIPSMRAHLFHRCHLHLSTSVCCCALWPGASDFRRPAGVTNEKCLVSRGGFGIKILHPPKRTEHTTESGWDMVLTCPWNLFLGSSSRAGAKLRSRSPKKIKPHLLRFQQSCFMSSIAPNIWYLTFPG